MAVCGGCGVCVVVVVVGGVVGGGVCTEHLVKDFEQEAAARQPALAAAPRVFPNSSGSGSAGATETNWPASQQVRGGGGQKVRYRKRKRATPVDRREEEMRCVLPRVAALMTLSGGRIDSTPLFRFGPSCVCCTEADRAGAAGQDTGGSAQHAEAWVLGVRVQRELGAVQPR